MNLRTKITTDKILGNTFIFIFGIFIKFISFFYNTKFDKTKPVKRIVICKLLGMGSIIQSTPLIKTLKKNFPNSELIYITAKKNLDLIKIINIVDKIYVIDDSNLFILIISIIKFKLNFLLNRVDYYIDLEVHSNFSSLLSFLSLAKFRIGYYLKEEWFRVCLYTEMIFYNTNAPIVNVYIQSAKLIGIKNEDIELFDFRINKTSQNIFIKDKLKNLNSGFKEDYIVINPNASDLRIERRWHYKNYVELINSILKNNSPFFIVLTGNKNESEYVNKIYSEVDEELRQQIIDTSGKLSIEELITLIDESKFLVTNDSGPMHLAFALNKMTVALFGPCSPQQYITQKNVLFIYKNIYCSPCVHQFSISPCKGDNQCMKQLTIQEVFNAVQNILSESTEHFKLQIPQNIYYQHENSSPLGILNKRR